MSDQVSEGLLSPFLRNKRIAAVLPYLKGKVLDFGCGSGALAEYVSPENYLGVDIDDDSLQNAQRRFPDHTFICVDSLPDSKFDTVVTLAVIEHVPSPESFLGQLGRCLNNGDLARVVLTTPHPKVDWVHGLGARLGLFSHAAMEEHETLLDKAALLRCGLKAGLEMVYFRYFLAGANQLAVYKKA